MRLPLPVIVIVWAAAFVAELVLRAVTKVLALVGGEGS